MNDYTQQSVVNLLLQLKQNLEHHRRYGTLSLTSYAEICYQTEEDIEEWLVKEGYLKYPPSY